MKVYVVEIHYDYESHSIAGIFSSKEKAEQVKAEVEKDADILDGVGISEYVLDKFF